MKTVALVEKARAKINLTLHVGPLLEDGYHPLRSLVIFADVGDVVEMRSAQNHQSTLGIEGPFAQGLESDVSNLILKTAQFLSGEKFDFLLAKNLPIASGIGGGSADAAATARLLGCEHLTDKLMALGADIPVCVNSQTCLMEGRGERLTPLPGLGQLHAVLVNPGAAVSTSKIFASFDASNPRGNNLLDEQPIEASLLEMALAGRNDLQPSAISMAPVISTVLAALSAQENCQLARMSGSGATCFGLFASLNEAREAQKRINDQHPDWWCVQTVLGDTV